ncbi:MAG: transcription elongation factor GreA [Deltaproteobacteria bacterium]|nr:MAG: transcription elongation factor GreA [Deltaproteobacteria bacterium]
MPGPSFFLEGQMFDLREIIDRLRKEAESLHRELTVELPKEIGEAISKGDLSENAEYESAKERQSTIMSRLAQLNERIQALSSISLDDIPRDQASLGSTIFVENLETGEKRKFVIVPHEAMDGNPDFVSLNSPIGRAFLGARPGDEVYVKIPRGEMEFLVEKVITYHGDVLE